MALNTFVTLAVCGLLLCGFRYLCLAILKDTSGRRYAGQIASANHLTFLRAEALLAPADEFGVAIAAHRLDDLEESLDRDYRVVTCLLDNTADFVHLPPQRFMLMLDFHLMRLSYRVMRLLSPRNAKTAVLEMALIVAHLAQYAGERLITRRA